MAAARTRTISWERLEAQLQGLLTLKKLSKSSAQAASGVAQASARYAKAVSAREQSDAKLIEALPLTTKVAVHVLNLVVERLQGLPAPTTDSKSFGECLRAAMSWCQALYVCWQEDFAKNPSTTLPALVIPAFTSAGLLAALAALFKLMTPWLDTPTGFPAAAYSAFSAASSLFQRGLKYCSRGSLRNHPLLAPASAPIFAAWLAMLRHRRPGQLDGASASAAADDPASSGCKHSIINTMRGLSALCGRGTLLGKPVSGSLPDSLPEVQAAVTSTVLGSADMLELLLAGLAANVGCCWHKLQQGQSELKAPRKVPLRGLGVSSSSRTGSTGSSSGKGSGSRGRAAASSERQRQLLSVDVEPSHMQLLQHLGMVLPPFSTLLRADKGATITPRMLVGSLDGLMSIVRSSDHTLEPSSHASTSSSTGQSSDSVLSTSKLCKLSCVLMEVLLMLDAQQCTSSSDRQPLSVKTLGIFNYITTILCERCCNTQGGTIGVGPDAEAGPAPDSEASDTALHLLRLWLHHVVPALLYACKHAPGSATSDSQSSMQSLGLTVRQCVGTALGGRTTIDSWQELATTDQSAIRALIQQQPLQSLLALELAVRQIDMVQSTEPFTRSDITSLASQLSLSLALFGVPALSPAAACSNELPVGLLSPQLLAAAATDNPPGLRQRLLSLLATGLKLAVLEAEAAPANDPAPGVLATGLVASICRCFNAFSSSCADRLADAPPAAQAQLRQELVAMMGRVLHAAGRVQQLLYEGARPQPASGSMPCVLLSPSVHACFAGHWVAVVRLEDLQVLTEVLDCSRSALVSMQLPEGVLQSLLQQQSELIELHAPFSSQMQVLSLCVFDEDHDSPPSVASWRQQVPEWLDEGAEVAAKLQAYGAALAALYPRNYMCNNLKCREIDHETESAAAAKMCSLCKQARYCCAACQQANWRGLHKVACKRLQAEATATSAAGS